MDRCSEEGVVGSCRGKEEAEDRSVGSCYGKEEVDDRSVGLDQYRAVGLAVEKERQRIGGSVL